MRLTPLLCLLGLLSTAAYAESVASPGGFGLGQPLYQGDLDLTPPKAERHSAEVIEDGALLPDMFAPQSGRSVKVDGSLTTGDSGGSFLLDPKSIEGAELRISIPN